MSRLIDLDDRRLVKEDDVKRVDVINFVTYFAHGY